MIRLTAMWLAVSAPAAAQQSTLTFEGGKLLPLAQGQWSHVATATGSEARFAALLTLRCDRPTRTVTISRNGSLPAALSIATDSMTRALPATGRVPASDPLLDAIAFSRGRFLVWGGGGPTLAVPSWPEAARSIEDCRN